MKLVFATANPHKIKEIKPYLPDNITLLSLNDIGCTEEIAETARTIAGNAKLKADYVKNNYHYACFADDTGLEVDALNGGPGVYSARYAGPQKNDRDNVGKLLENLKGHKNRKAQFKTVITLDIDDHQENFVGICRGRILKERQGNGGFGYDPIFQPDGFRQSFAEMALDQKTKISHRGKALAQLKEYLNKHF